jgi:uncharacterized protein YbjT (DUF2867 family)
MQLPLNYNDKPSVLVTAFSGLIRRHLVAYVAAQGHEVIVASRIAPEWQQLNFCFGRNFKKTS